MIKVLLADDHALVRRGFRRLLEDEPDIEVIGEAGTGREAIAEALNLHPDVVVMDYAMPDLDGVQATMEIGRQLKSCAVLMLSMHSDETYRRNALEAGARGYIMKNAVEVNLAEAIRDVAAGGTCGLPENLPPDEARTHAELTPRERQILQLIAQGKSNRDIAELLGLSVNTIAVHRNNLMHKMRIHRTAELVLYAIRHGLVTPA
jgi:DNA-binding NarL/FixJ family response regulator